MALQKNYLVGVGTDLGRSLRPLSKYQGGGGTGCFKEHHNQTVEIYCTLVESYLSFLILFYIIYWWFGVFLIEADNFPDVFWKKNCPVL